MSEWLTHVFVAYSLLTLASWRLDWLDGRWIAVGVVGSILPDFSRLDLLVDADTVSYTFAAGDLSQSGSHKAEFHVNYSDSTVEIAPQDGYFSVQVLEDLN